MKQPTHFLIRAALAATIAAGSLLSVASATEVDRRASAAAPAVRAAPANSSAARLIGEGLEQLGWEAAMIDSSVFGQLRLLRDVEPRIIEAPTHSDTTKACR